MDKRIKYSLKQRLSAVESIEAGHESCLTAARKIGSNEYTVYRWLKLYQHHGQEGLEHRRRNYPGEFKIQVIRYMLKNKLSLVKTAAIFGVPQDHTIGFWLKRYASQGAAGLLKDSRNSRSSTMAKKTKKSNKTSPEPIDERLAALEAELLYLRAENAFLKKLDALIQEEKTTRIPNKRQKPSGN